MRGVEGAAPYNKGKRKTGGMYSHLFLIDRVLCFAEYILAQTAPRTGEVFGNLFPRGAGFDVVVGGPYCGVVFIAAYADIFFHDVASFDFG